MSSADTISACQNVSSFKNNIFLSNTCLGDLSHRVAFKIGTRFYFLHVVS